MLVQYTQIIGWGWDNGPGKALLHGATLVFLTWTNNNYNNKTVKMYLTSCKPTTISKKEKKDRCCFTEQVSVRQNWQKCLFILVALIHCFQRLLWIKSPALPLRVSCAAALPLGVSGWGPPLTGCTEGLIPGRGHHRFQLWSDQYSTLFPAWQSIRHT